MILFYFFLESLRATSHKTTRIYFSSGDSSIVLITIDNGWDTFYHFRDNVGLEYLPEALKRALGEDFTNLLILHSSGMSDEHSTNLLIFSSFGASVKKIRPEGGLCSC